MTMAPSWPHTHICAYDQDRDRRLRSLNMMDRTFGYYLVNTTRSWRCLAALKYFKADNHLWGFYEECLHVCVCVCVCVHIWHFVTPSFWQNNRNTKLQKCKWGYQLLQEVQNVQNSLSSKKVKIQSWYQAKATLQPWLRSGCGPEKHPGLHPNWVGYSPGRAEPGHEILELHSSGGMWSWSECSPATPAFL